MRETTVLKYYLSGTRAPALLGVGGCPSSRQTVDYQPSGVRAKTRTPKKGHLRPGTRVDAVITQRAHRCQTFSFRRAPPRVRPPLLNHVAAAAPSRRSSPPLLIVAAPHRRRRRSSPTLLIATTRFVGHRGRAAFFCFTSCNLLQHTSADMARC